MATLLPVSKEYCEDYIKSKAIKLNGKISVVVSAGVVAKKAARKTAEGKVNDHLEEWFNSRGIYWVRVLSASRNGVTDYLACVDGKFVSIECKKDSGRLQDNQVDQMLATLNSGGHALVIKGIVPFEQLDEWRKGINDSSL